MTIAVDLGRKESNIFQVLLIDKKYARNRYVEPYGVASIVPVNKAYIKLNLFYCSYIVFSFYFFQTTMP